MTAKQNIVIRAATAGDVQAIGRLGAMLVSEHHDFDPQRFIPATPQTAQGYGEYLGTQMGKQNIVILVAESGGAVIGYTYSGLEPIDYMALRGPAGALYDIVVDPAHRKLGVGAQLLEATIVALEERGAPRVVLSTAEKNESAHHLFARAGFRRTMIEMTRERGGG